MGCYYSVYSVYISLERLCPTFEGEDRGNQPPGNKGWWFIGEINDLPSTIAWTVTSLLLAESVMLPREASTRIFSPSATMEGGCAYVPGSISNTINILEKKKGCEILDFWQILNGRPSSIFLIHFKWKCAFMATHSSVVLATPLKRLVHDTCHIALDASLLKCGVKWYTSSDMQLKNPHNFFLSFFERFFWRFFLDSSRREIVSKNSRLFSFVLV